MLWAMSTPPGPIQYSSRKLTPEEDLAKLREQEVRLMQSAQAPNTVKAYAHSWKQFCAWCGNWRGCESLPASPQALREFATWASEMREPPYKPETIQLALSAIRWYHRDAGCVDPVDDSVRTVMAGVTRKAARNGARKELAGKKHLSVALLKKICRALSITEPIDVRDRALLVVGFASALRRSDLSRLDTSHVEFEANRVRLWVPVSKTDQHGAGRALYLDSGKDPLVCPVRALEEWKRVRLEHCGYWRGPLFCRFYWQYGASVMRLDDRLQDQGICRMLQLRLEQMGEDPHSYGAHSLRSGMITSAHQAGANIRSIMDRSGHKSMSMVVRYLKSDRTSNPLAKVL